MNARSMKAGRSFLRRRTRAAAEKKRATASCEARESLAGESP